MAWKTSLPEKKIVRNWYKPPIDNNTNGKPILRPNKPQDRAPFKFHKCQSKSHFAYNFPKKTIINEIEIENTDLIKENNDVNVHESDSKPSEEEEIPDEFSIQTINVSFEVTEVNAHLPQYGD
ncbi:hypothetical protein O181_003278 [Austropuccinia psidii MF-1]|uniref:Uncharacterized protein n=1 Tax=Austropuccinia psidii MF-1 TaxID=1389203 RepID=A0A9Q3BE52_9BASI|nr:hypothetical protein [Austropuccinia psidii MF-1]